MRHHHCKLSYSKRCLVCLSLTSSLLVLRGGNVIQTSLTGQDSLIMIWQNIRNRCSDVSPPQNGWPLVALVNPRSFTDPAEEIECGAGAGKAKVKSALRKFLKNKTTSKTVLSTLVSQFSWVTNLYNIADEIKVMNLCGERCNLDTRDWEVEAQDWKLKMMRLILGSTIR